MKSLWTAHDMGKSSTNEEMMSLEKRVSGHETCITVDFPFLSRARKHSFPEEHNILTPVNLSNRNLYCFTLGVLNSMLYSTSGSYILSVKSIFYLSSLHND